MDFEILSDTALIRGAFYPTNSSKAPCLIVCHGMPASPRKVETDSEYDTGNDLTYEEIAELFVDLGIAAVIFNFRGTGASTGDYHPMGWVADLNAVIDWVSQRHEVDLSNLGLLGSSMGAAIAIAVASGRDDIKFLITYASPSIVSKPSDPLATIQNYRDMGIINSNGFPQDPEEWAKEFDSIVPVELIRKITCDYMLLVHGDADDVVPVQSAYHLAEFAPPHAELHIQQGAGHRFRSEPKSIETILNWMGKIFAD
jgi:alpha/beta superfamily hydrolase